MNLEDFLSGDDSFIKSLSRQKNELSLAKNWLEETGGEIVEGLHTDEVGYVTSLRELPLYEDIKDDLELYVDLVGKERLSVSISDEHKVNTYVLKHFMTVKHSLEHFLLDPDYASGSGGRGVSFGSALSLGSVLSDYVSTLNDGAGGLKGRRGDCVKIYRAIEKGYLNEDELLLSIGLADEWSAYQETRGVTKDYRRLAKKTLTHFLLDPDYASGYGKVSFGSALVLRSVLSDYVSTLNDGDGGLINQKGDCVKIYQAIKKGRLTDDELLSSVGLADEWSAYQETRGVTKDYRRLAKKTLTHFLSDPDYASGYGKVSFGSALGLSSVLSDYVSTLNDGTGGLKDRRGDCVKIYHAIRRGNLAEDELLLSIGLEDEWSSYQETRGVTKDYRRLAKKTLTHFLSDPDYASGKGKVSFGSALGLSSVLRDYVSTLNDGDGGLSSKKGDCYKIYQAIKKGRLTDDELLSSVGLVDEWSAYQRSDIDNPYKN